MVQHIYRWTGATGGNTFGVAANWIDEATGQVGGIPGAGDIGQFSGTEYVTGTGALSTLDTDGTGELGFVLGGSLAVSDDANMQGSNWINGGTLSLGYDFVGYNGVAGTLAVTSNSAILAGSAAGAGLLVGENGAAGTLSVSGTNAVVNLGTLGTLNVGYSAYGSYSATSFGTATISGGARVSAGSANIGWSATGALLLTGAGSALTLSGSLDAGFGGNGNVSILSLATLTCNGLEVGDLGDVHATRNDGTISVSGATVTDTGYLGIGNLGNASLLLANGAYLSAVGGQIALEANAVGTISLTGQATHLALSGGLNVGASGHAELDVLSGALLTSSLAGTTTYGVTVGGSTANGGSTMTVSGGMAIISAGLSVGEVGTGTLLVSNGGTVVVNAAGGYYAPLELGGTPDSAGIVTVTGPGSVLDANGWVLVGDEGDGTLTVMNQAVLNAGSLILQGGTRDGIPGTETGTASVLGTATLHVAGGTQIGGDSLLVSGGSSFSGAGGVTIARFFERAGTLSATGTGASVTVGGGLVVGGEGSLFAISGGAHATVAASPGQAIIIDTGASVSLTNAGSMLSTSGAALQVGDALGGTGTITGGGTLVISDGGTLVSSGGSGTVGLQSLSAIIGNGATGEAASTVLVSGRDAASGLAAFWQVNDGLEIGYSAADAASLSVLLGGTVSVTGMLALGTQGSTLRVDGAGSLVKAMELVTFGRTDTVITNGAVISAQSALVGDVSLGGGALKVAGLLDVGWMGSVVGSGTIRATVTQIDQGSAVVASGKLGVMGGISGAGSLVVDGGGTLVLTGPGAVTAGLSFLAGGGMVETGAPAKLASLITGWSAGDVIDLTQVSVSRERYSGGTLSLFGASGHALSSLHFAGALTGANFTLSADGHGGTLIGFHG